jgi:hypothetical protein
MGWGLDLDHTRWEVLLKTYVTPESRVDYGSLKTRGVVQLDAYIAELEAPWPDGMEPEETKAALINAYNALTVRWILSNYPVKSIWRTGDPFRVARHTLDGASVSLDQIEGRLRDLGDPRIHSALVCASLSCPPLRREAYLASRLDEQLDDNFRSWLARTALNHFDPRTRTAQISSIFKWYAGDFSQSGGVGEFLSRYAPVGQADFVNSPAARIEYATYDWGLNDTSMLGADYSEANFYVDWARNGYLWSEVKNWFFGLGEKYGVNPVVFGTIYVGAIPFFSASLAWLVRNIRQRRSPVIPALATGFCFVSAYLYLLIAGRNIPFWVYSFIVAMVCYGVYSTSRTIKVKVKVRDAAYSNSLYNLASAASYGRDSVPVMNDIGGLPEARPKQAESGQTISSN